MKSKGIGPFCLQLLLKGGAYFDPWTRQEESQAAARGAIRFELIYRAERREISRIVQVDFRVEGKSATQHHAIAGAGPQWKDQRGGLQAADPNWIKTFVINAKGCEESSGSNGQVWVGDVIDLHIVKLLRYLPAVRPATIAAFELSFELRPGLDKPAIS